MKPTAIVGALNLLVRLRPLLFGTLEKNQELSEDLPNAMNATEITDKLGLHSLRQRHWYIQSTCATSSHARNEDLMPATTWTVECSSNNVWSAAACLP